MSRKLNFTLSIISIFFLITSASAEGSRQGVTAGLGEGVLFFEADEEVNPGIIVEGKLGYNFNNRWGVEGGIGYLPNLDKNRFNPPAGPLNERFALSDDTWGLRAAVDVLYHLDDNAEAELDPYLAVTGGVMYYDRSMEDDQHFDPFAGAGAGLGVQIAKNLFLRGDYRFLVAGHDTENNHLTLISLNYLWSSGAEEGSGAADAGAMGAIAGAAAEKVMVPVYFNYDSAVLTPQAKEKLKKNAEWLADNSNTEIVVEGHCDERGTNDYNLALGQRRAESARKYLRGLGVSADRMESVSYGEDRPAATGHNESAWSLNRRAECVVK